MFRIKTLAGTTVPVLLALACMSGLTSTAQAQEANPESRQFSAKTGEMVLAARNHALAEEHQAALDLLAQALTRADISSFEHATILQMQGGSYYQLGEFIPAITAFEQAIRSGGLNAKEIADMQVKIAQLMIAAGRHAEGAQALENYLKAGGQEKAEYVELLMQAWIQAENYTRALPWGQKWFAAANPKERRHFDLMNLLYHRLGQSSQQADIVKQMITRWPEDGELWEAWTSLFAAANKEEDAFAVTKLRYLGGALTTEAEILKVVQYYSYYEMPYQAAQILEKELNAGRVTRGPERLVQLATLFRQAREYGRAIPVLEAATQGGGTAAIYAQLGEALYNEGECARAETAFKHAIDRGYAPGKAWTLIATCRYEEVQRQKKLSCEMSEAEKAAAPKTKARQSTLAAFEKVPPRAKEYNSAKKWISFVKGERLTFDKRCEFELKELERKCLQQIGQAYEEQVLTREFRLDDPKCMAFKSRYDQEFRPANAG